MADTVEQKQSPRECRAEVNREIQFLEVIPSMILTQSGCHDLSGTYRSYKLPSSDRSL